MTSDEINEEVRKAAKEIVYSMDLNGYVAPGFAADMKLRAALALEPTPPREPALICANPYCPHDGFKKAEEPAPPREPRTLCDCSNPYPPPHACYDVAPPPAPSEECPKPDAGRCPACGDGCEGEGVCECDDDGCPCWHGGTGRATKGAK